MIDLLGDDDLLDLRSRARRTDPSAVTREERGRHRHMPESNPDLEAWSKDARPPAEPAEEAASGECSVEPGRRAKHTCRQCGLGACSEHFWVMFGLCTHCATPERIQRWHAESAPEGQNWLEDADPAE